MHTDGKGNMEGNRNTLVTFSFFCFTCKRHVTINAESQKVAKQAFLRSSHDDTKLEKLPPTVHLIEPWLENVLTFS